MKRNPLFFIFVLLPLVANAVAVSIDGIWYNLTSETKQAEVTANPEKYTGEVNIPASVTYEDIEYNVTSIGKQAFYSCKALTSVSIPDEVTSIGSNAFDGCTSLSSVTLGNGLTSIGDYAFYGCTSLSSIAIPTAVTSIGRDAFYYCASLASITIPDDVTNIGYNAFENTPWMNKQPDGLMYIGKVAYRYKGTMPKGTEITIDDGTVQIASYAFYGYSNMTAINIPESVTSIEGSAFRECTGLTSITFPKNITTISGSAFSGCSGLTDVTIPGGVTSIGTYAFERCTSLASVIIPASVKSIGWYAFSGCKSLMQVWCYAEKVPSTGNDAFDKTNIEIATLLVPTASIRQYTEAIPWKKFGTIISNDGTPGPPEPQKCETPTITYADGELKFDCKTEGVEFVYEITDTDIKKGNAARVSLTATYHISVYAKKTGYKDSDVATATLCWIDAEPKTEGMEGDALVEVKALPVLIQSHGGNITVRGLEPGTEVSAYSTSGMLLDTVLSAHDSATLRTTLPSGSTAIVKIGNKAVQVMVR